MDQLDASSSLSSAAGHLGARLAVRGVVEQRRTHGRALVFLVLRLLEPAPALPPLLQVVLSRRALLPAAD